ncbi:RNA demethylase ALKBH10B-like isoform X2 [Telopea speciosissima]|uniref:RNA demethylase ALKBH10B-like isoform X2 n=1 Tax=Telopea speciosissima TaxID=54955 RepID=UPI001CC4CFE9|nr:RNA demethylase ALKBH10B-like isoform X2 [Telopea speciosissima]
MPTAACPVPPADKALMASTMPIPAAQMPSETFARDAIIAWFRGEFAAANAIIDALCNHLTQLDGLDGHGAEYESVFGAIHRRRLNWIPILQMQKYYSIADVALELKKVASKKMMREGGEKKKIEEVKVFYHKKEESSKDANGSVQVVNGESGEEMKESEGEAVDEVVEEVSSVDDQSDRKANDEAEEQLPEESIQICSNHEDCENRRDQIKTTKGFVAKELVKGHMVNVVKGLKLYEDIFTDSELSKLNSFVNQLLLAGRNGELSGETFILFNKQLKGNERELIQLGVPIFGQIRDETNSKSQRSNIEPIPPVLQAVIDHLVQWHLIPESRKPNSCIINFFDEGEYSQPYLKPPHLDQPTSTLLLSESNMAFGRVLMSDQKGNFKGSLMVSIKEGSLLVMRGKSADMARHVICASSNKRVSITFSKVRLDTNNQMRPSTTPPLTRAMTVWQPGVPQPYTMPNGTFNGYEAIEMVPKWGVLRAPLVMLTPVPPMVINPRRIPRGGTGVFLPWTVGSKKPPRHLPPRAQKGRLLALPSSVETQAGEPISDSGARE